MIERLRAGGCPLHRRRKLPRWPQTLLGKTVVVTGTLQGFSREQAEARHHRPGGKSPGSVSAKTMAVVVGESPGAAKLTKGRVARRPDPRRGGFRQAPRDRRAALDGHRRPARPSRRALPGRGGQASAREAGAIETHLPRPRARLPDRRLAHPFDRGGDELAPGGDFLAVRAHGGLLARAGRRSLSSRHDGPLGRARGPAARREGASGTKTPPSALNRERGALHRFRAVNH